MPPMTLYLARHGESVSNFENVFIGRSRDPELTEKGIEQARNLALSLKSKSIDAIFSSSLVRARQTAQIVADEVGIPVTFSDDLIEVGLGRLDGHDISDKAFLSIYENMVSNWESGYPHVSVPGGESLLDVKKRIDQFLDENILNRIWNGPILLVGHAILWMGLIWLFCENRSSIINDGFMSKTNLSIISKNGGGYFLKHNNLTHSEIVNMNIMQ